ncbi:hypothetical protein GCM10010289_85810 [Streptomyces violascens]|nr:hypothetical protein GCM10010289_85810 [Streptomyces violascens]
MYAYVAEPLGVFDLTVMTLAGRRQVVSAAAAAARLRGPEMFLSGQSPVGPENRAEHGTWETAAAW